MVEESVLEVLRGAEVLEIRPSAMTKASAVGWLRQCAGEGATLIAFGDDVTDEDMFHALGESDVSILVGVEGKRATAARWHLDAPENTVGFLRWLLAARRDDAPGASLDLPRPIGDRPNARSPYRLLVVSNRLPELRSTADSADPRKRSVGGLVSAVEPALRARDGVWLGWSGAHVLERRRHRVRPRREATPKLAWVDLPGEMARLLLQRVLQQHRSGRSFIRFRVGCGWPRRTGTRMADANEAFSTAAMRIVAPESAVWISNT